MSVIVAECHPKEEVEGEYSQPPNKETCGDTLIQFHSCVAKHACNGNTYLFYLKYDEQNESIYGYWDKGFFLNPFNNVQTIKFIRFHVLLLFETS